MTTPSKYYTPVPEISCPVCLKSYKQGNYGKHTQSKHHLFAMQLINRFVAKPVEFSTQTV